MTCKDWQLSYHETRRVQQNLPTNPQQRIASITHINSHVTRLAFSHATDVRCLNITVS